MARIGKFCIDKWEAHLVVPADGGDMAPWPHSERPPSDLRFEARSAAGTYPQGYISRVEATAACQRAGKRLCRMGEWRRACEGKRHGHYPYGMNSRAGACNSGKPHLLSQMFGPGAGGWTYDSFNDPRLLKEPGFLSKGGDYPECAGEEGVFDMVGNLHEWVADMVDQGVVDRLDLERVERRKQPWREGNGMFLGGFFSTTRELGPGCAYITIAHEPSYHDYSTGFRCCRSVE
jgi:formylglycine-generating enzyme